MSEHLNAMNKRKIRAKQKDIAVRRTLWKHP